MLQKARAGTAIAVNRGRRAAATVAATGDDLLGDRAMPRRFRPIAFRVPALLSPIAALALAGCLFGGSDAPRGAPPHRPRVPESPGFRPLTTRETQQCYTDLTRNAAVFEPVPDRDFGNGCTMQASVRLLDIGIPVTGLKAMRCPLARAFTGWVHYAVAPAARQILGSDVVRIESYGTFVCRAIVGGGAATAGKLSEHAAANAVDVSAFVLKDGRRVRILDDWRSPDPAVREFLTVIHRSACKRFQTVLSPDYNAAHRDHLHLDMGRGPFCR